MKIAVCDDNPSDCKTICEYLKKYSDEFMLDYEVAEYYNGEELLKVCADTPFGIVFLDIYMEGLSGVSLAYQLRAQEQHCAIIFTTSSPDFRADGFEVGAVHYLIKPITYDGVWTALERCKHLLLESERHFNVVTNRLTVKIRLRDVLFAEVYKNQVLIHTTSGIVSTYSTLSELLTLMNDRRFLMCHRCYIVNMKYITQLLEEDFLLSNGEKVPIRKNGRQQIKEWYGNYLFQSVKETVW